MSITFTLKAVSQLFETWGEFRAVLGLLATDSSSPPGELEFMFDRMANLRSMLFQFGFDLGSLELPVEIAVADPQIANELIAVLDELDWQFIDLEREICRRREIIRVALNENENHHFDSWTQRTTHSSAARQQSHTYGILLKTAPNSYVHESTSKPDLSDS